jgi:hypothetical protein
LGCRQAAHGHDANEHHEDCDHYGYYWTAYKEISHAQLFAAIGLD